MISSSSTVTEPSQRASSGRGLGQHFRVAMRSLGEMLDVGLLVLGTAIVALGITVLLDGFSVVDLGLTDSAGAMLGSGIILGVPRCVRPWRGGRGSDRPCGQTRHGRPPRASNPGGRCRWCWWGLGMLALSTFLRPAGLRAAHPLPGVGVELLGTIGLAGCTVAVVVGVPLLYLLERATTSPAGSPIGGAGSSTWCRAIGAAHS